MGFMEKDFQEVAVSLLLTQKPNLNKNNIKKIELLSGGFTNHCFYVETNEDKDFKFFVRVGSNKIDRTHEFSYLKASKEIEKYLYYDFDSGNAIKKWQEGITSTFEDCKKINIFTQIVKEIKKLQLIKLEEVPDINVRDFYQFIKLAKIDDIYLSLMHIS